MMTIPQGQSLRFLAFSHAEVLCEMLAEILQPSHRLFAETQELLSAAPRDN